MNHMARLMATVIRVLQMADENRFILFREKLLQLIAKTRRLGLRPDFNRMRMESIKKGRLLIGPRVLLIDVMDQCNYRCQFCFTHSSLSSEGRQEALSHLWNPPASYESVKEILDDAFAMGTEYVRFCGEGELLLHKDIKKIVAYALSLHMQVQLVTNLSRETVIADFDFISRISFLVNLASVSAAKYEVLHGVPADQFDVVLGNIRRMSVKHHVVLSYLINSQNCEDIGAYIELAASLGVKDIRFLMPRVYEAELKSMLVSAEQLNVLGSRLAAWEDLARAKDINVNMAELRALVADRGFVKNSDILEQSSHKMKCFNSWFFSKVSTNGDVFMCCNETIPIGRISKEQRFKDVFFSTRSLQTALTASNGVDPAERQWKKCMICGDKRQHAEVARHLGNRSIG